MVDTFIYFFKTIVPSMSNILFCILYRIVQCFFVLLDFIEALFRRLAGIEGLSFGGTSYGGDNGLDLVYGFITNSIVQNAFWAILAFSVVLLIVFTIVAIIKTEFTPDITKYAKTPIIARALKAIAQFFVVPIVLIVGVLAATTLTQTVYGVFGTSEKISISVRCFEIGAYNANRARNDEKFRAYLRNTSYFLSSGTNPFLGLTDEQMATLIDSYVMGETLIDGKNPIDRNGNYVINLLDYKIPTKEEALDWDDAGLYVPWEALSSFANFPDQDAKTVPYYDFDTVNFYYEVSQFDYLLCLGAAIILTGNFLSVTLALFQRVFEMIILFIITPIPISMAPLDSGSALGRWREYIVKRLFAVVVPVFAYNVFLILMPLILEIKLIGLEDTVVFNQLYTLIALIVGAGFIKKSSSMLSNILGVNDLVSEGEGMMSSVVKKGATVGAIGIGSTIVAAKLGKSAVKTLGKGAKVVKKGASSVKSGVLSGVDYVRAKTSEEGKELFKTNKNIVKAQKDLDKLKKQGYTEETDEYKEAKRRYDSSVQHRSDILKDIEEESKDPNNTDIEKYKKKNAKLDRKKIGIENHLRQLEMGGYQNSADYQKRKAKLNKYDKKIEKNIQKSKGFAGVLEKYEKGLEDNGVGALDRTSHKLKKVRVKGKENFEKGKNIARNIKQKTPEYVKDLTKDITFGNLIKNVESLLSGTGADNILGPIHSILGGSKKKIFPNLGKKKQKTDALNQAKEQELIKQEAKEAARDELVARKDMELVKGIVAAEMLKGNDNKLAEYDNLKRALQEALRGGDPIDVVNKRREEIGKFEAENGIDQEAKNRYRKIDSDETLSSELIKKKAELQAKADAQAAKEAGVDVKDMIEGGKMKLADEQVKDFAKKIGDEFKKNLEEVMKKQSNPEATEKLKETLEGLNSGFSSFKSAIQDLIKELKDKE